MNTDSKRTNLKPTKTLRIRLIPAFFDEDPQLNPGLCWERKQKSQDLCDIF